MTDKELEKLFENDLSLAPRAELKNEILERAYAEMDSQEAQRENGTKVKSATSLFKRLKLWVPIAACLLLAVLVTAGLWGASNEEYQTFYIDVNPSLEISLNRFDNVSSVKYLNEDAENALKGTDLIGCSPEEALETVLNAYDKHGYFDGEAELYISVLDENGESSQELLNRLKSHAEKSKGNRKYNVNTCTLSKEDRENAQKHDVSPGKYQIISRIIEQSPDYSVEELKDFSMSELKKIEKELKKK